MEKGPWTCALQRVPTKVVASKPFVEALNMSSASCTQVGSEGELQLSWRLLFVICLKSDLIDVSQSSSLLRWVSFVIPTYRESRLAIRSL